MFLLSVMRIIHTSACHEEVFLCSLYPATGVVKTGQVDWSVC